MTNTKNGSNQGMVPEARAAMDRFKMEAAADLGVYSPQKAAVIFEVNKRQRGLVLTSLKIDCFVDFTDGLSVHIADEAVEDADTLAVRSPRACNLLTLR